MKEPIALVNDVTIKIDESGIAFSLRSRDFKDAQIVVVREENDIPKNGRDPVSGRSSGQL